MGVDLAYEDCISQNSVGFFTKEMALPMNGKTSFGPGRNCFFLR